MSGYAIDSNIISFILRRNFRVREIIYREANSGAGVIIPAMVYYEVKRGLKYVNSKNKLDAFERLCKVLTVDRLDERILDNAADIYASLRMSGKLIDDADILIAASCIANGYILISDNKRHFERVSGLNLINWDELSDVLD